MLAARLVFHAVYVPAYEGPDEPFHLGRAAAFADDSLREAFVGDRLSGSIVSSVRDHPCCANLNVALGCAPFSRHGAFNIAAAESSSSEAASIVNYEAHQPPLFYAAVSPLLKPIVTPVRRLLAMRLFSVVLVLVALAFPIRRVAAGEHEHAFVIFLLFLLLPGAAEALARGSNDAAVFLWTAIIVERLLHGSDGSLLIPLLALGPLLKLTAFPVVVVAVSAMWLRGRRPAAIVGALASLLVLGVQALRGWSWGGTYELNRAAQGMGSHEVLLVGLSRSLYTFGKTIFWLGEWSFFRAPLSLVGAWLVVVASLLVRHFRRGWWKNEGIAPRAHLFGVMSAVAGLLAMAILNRRLFGEWGGLGGWYFWVWTPWLAVAARPALAGGRRWIAFLAGFVALANVQWFIAAHRLYGP